MSKTDPQNSFKGLFLEVKSFLDDNRGEKYSAESIADAIIEKHPARYDRKIIVGEKERITKAIKNHVWPKISRLGYKRTGGNPQTYWAGYLAGQESQKPILINEKIAHFCYTIDGRIPMTEYGAEKVVGAIIPTWLMACGFMEIRSADFILDSSWGTPDLVVTAQTGQTMFKIVDLDSIDESIWAEMSQMRKIHRSVMLAVRAVPGINGVSILKSLASKVGVGLVLFGDVSQILVFPLTNKSGLSVGMMTEEKINIDRHVSSGPLLDGVQDDSALLEPLDGSGDGSSDSLTIEELKQKLKDEMLKNVDQRLFDAVTGKRFFHESLHEIKKMIPSLSKSDSHTQSGRAQLLYDMERFGIGYEPDVRFWGPIFEAVGRDEGRAFFSWSGVEENKRNINKPILACLAILMTIEESFAYRLMVDIQNEHKSTPSISRICCDAFNLSCGADERCLAAVWSIWSRRGDDLDDDKIKGFFENRASMFSEKEKKYFCGRVKKCMDELYPHSGENKGRAMKEVAVFLDMHCPIMAFDPEKIGDRVMRRDDAGGGVDVIFDASRDRREPKITVEPEAEQSVVLMDVDTNGGGLHEREIEIFTVLGFISHCLRYRDADGYVSESLAARWLDGKDIDFSTAVENSIKEIDDFILDNFSGDDFQSVENEDGASFPHNINWDIAQFYVNQLT